MSYDDMSYAAIYARNKELGGIISVMFESIYMCFWVAF